ncbi:hypothetical protein QYM41_05270 [Kocuria sp. CPCC 205268]|uniref:hypothetical protein n=1 Tax=Kocuria oxytropis TaxID=3058913 RepID=UPI0034D78CD4
MTGPAETPATPSSVDSSPHCGRWSARTACTWSWTARPAAHPHIDELAQAVLVEFPAEVDRGQAFLDGKKT